MAIDIGKALNNDEHMQEGFKIFQDMETKADSVAAEISQSILQSIIKEEDKFNVSTAILAIAKSLSHVTSFLYDSEEEFLLDVKKARTSVVSDIIPALLNPEPCGLCESCKNGSPEDCVTPNVRGDYTMSRFLPIVANMLIEYDLFNKVLYMHTAGKDKMNFDEASASQTEREEKDNGTNE